MSVKHLLFLLLLQSVSSLKDCPTACLCDLDDPLGRIRVSCDQGGLTGSLDLTGVSLQTEVLIISAPEDNLNSLMIGPIFGNLKTIQEIHIVRSNVPEIGDSSFWRLPTLEVLNLRENNISTVLDVNFNGIMKLEKLYLDENRIERLSSGTFKYLENLRVLSLSNNRLEELVTRVFEKLTKLQELNLSGNRLRELNPEAFMDIQSLKVLQCRNCDLSTVNNAFFHLIPELTILDFGENNFKYLSADDMAELPNLQSLWFDGNKIDAIQQRTFSDQKDLKKLNIAHNKIKQIAKDAFRNLTNLRELNLGYNNLQALDVSIFEAFTETLHSLDLSGNFIPITETKIYLRQLKRIQDLHLNSMGLSELPLGLFDFNRDLSSLALAKNYFIFFPVGALSPVPKLKSLDFSHNKLRGLDWKSLQRIESIDEVNFASNPWSCDLCYIVPMLVKMNSTTFLQNAVCKTPYYLKGKKLGDLEVDHLKRCTAGEITGDYFIQENKLRIIAAGAGILLLVLTVLSLLAGVCYTRRHARHYYTNEEKRQDQDPICETTDLVFIENGEISFKFPMEKKISISTIDIKKDSDFQNET